MLSVSLLEIPPEDHVFFYLAILSPLKEKRAWSFIWANLIKSTSMLSAKFSYYVDPVVLYEKLYMGKEVQIDGQWTTEYQKSSLKRYKKTNL